MRMHTPYILLTALALAALIVLSIALCAADAEAKGTLRIVYELPEPEDVAAARTVHQSEVAEEVAQIVEDWSLLPKNVTLRFGTQLGPYFAVLQSGKLEIHIPYSFFSKMKKLFASKTYVEQQSPTTSALNTLHHAIYHELGHAVIYSQKTGISDKTEEDAVDTLSVILLISVYADGADIAASAAKAFQLLATEPDSTLNLQNDIERFQEINCLVYGSDPEKYQELINDLPVNSESVCPERFIAHHKQWEKIFRIPLPD